MEDKMKAAILCAQGLEECEALLTYDLLTRAGIKTDLLGLDEYITSSHNVTFKTHGVLKDAVILDYDCIILPGGIPGTPNLEKDELVQNAIDSFVLNNRLIAAVCAAPSILNHKGLLKDSRFTCYPGFECDLNSSHKKADQDGNIITGIGLGGTMEFASLIIKNLLGEEKAQEVLNKIQY